MVYIAEDKKRKSFYFKQVERPAFYVIKLLPISPVGSERVGTGDPTGKGDEEFIKTAKKLKEK